MNYLEKRGYVTEWGTEHRKWRHQNLAQPYAKHVGSYHLIGEGGKHSSNFLKAMRADVADRYYDVMFGEDRGVREWKTTL